VTAKGKKIWGASDPWESVSARVGNIRIFIRIFFFEKYSLFEYFFLMNIRIFLEMFFVGIGANS
jgi:hypothetical protein